MEYGLRRYEATQRLLWFVLFLLCLGVAYLVTQSYPDAPSGLPALNPSFDLQAMKSLAFWVQLRWIQVEPLGKVMIFLIWVAVLFLLVHSVWLAVQVVGKVLIKRLLDANVKKASVRPATAVSSASINPERFFPTTLLLSRINRLPLQLVFQPFQRLRLMLTNPQGTLASEELTDKERRIVEVDWQILWSSWTPFRWLLWILPVLAVIQAGWLFALQIQPALSGQKDLPEVLRPLFSVLFPLIQVVAIVIALHIASGLLKRLDNLYLSTLDALFYDQFLARLPFQSSDTLIVLEALRQHFQELHSVLRRVERSVNAEKGPVEKAMLGEEQ